VQIRARFGVPQTPRRSRLRANYEPDFATADHTFGQFHDSYHE
jgi:hypothetical protein